MRIRSKLAAIALSTGLTLAGIAGTSLPAEAANSGNTIATFTITAGTLDITVPASTVALATGTISTGTASASTQLGAVTVADNRGALVNTWTTTVSSTTFVLPGASPTADETVPKSTIAYSSA